MTVTIYHNPRCSNSRACLALIREAGVEPRIVEYLTTPLTRAELAALAKKTGLTPRELVRSKEAVFAELDLAEADDDTLLDAISAHPVLLNRPIVVADKGAALCRPPERVKALIAG